MDSLTKLLLERYQPDSPLLQSATPVIKAKVPALVVIEKDGRTFIVMLSSSDHAMDVIEKACNEHNMLNGLKQQSQILLHDLPGVALKGSWIMVN